VSHAPISVRVQVLNIPPALATAAVVRTSHGHRCSLAQRNIAADDPNRRVLENKHSTDVEWTETHNRASATEMSRCKVCSHTIRVCAYVSVYLSGSLGRVLTRSVGFECLSSNLNN